MSNSANSCIVSPNLTSLETSYIQNSFKQIVDTLGTTVTYKSQTLSGTNTYGMNVIGYTSQTINALLNNLSERDYSYVEPGFLPTHYADLWIYSLVPQVGDRVDWKGIEFEVRASLPQVAGSLVVYYRCILRRTLLPTLGAGGP